MKPEDKIQIEMTALEAYCIYAMLGNTKGGVLQKAYDQLEIMLDPEQELISKLCEEDWKFYNNDNQILELVEATVFAKGSEKSTDIAKIKEQLKELEKRLEKLENEE